MPNSNQTPGAADTFGQNFADRARQVGESVSDMARTAGNTIDENRASAADRLEDAASAVRDTANTLPGGERVKEFAQGAAARLSTGADYVRSHDVDRMLADVKTAVRNNPGIALLGAAAFGFLFGRALSRD